MKAIILYISSKQFGTGHFKRAHDYKRELSRKNIQVVTREIEDYFKAHSNNFVKKLKKFNLIILDISNKNFFQNKKIKKKLELLFYNYSNRIGVIDGLDKDQLVNKNFFKCKFVIVPYFFLKKNISRINAKYFIGPNYLFLKKFKQKKRKNFQKNILITCGGSDLNNSSLKIVKLILKTDLSSKKLNIIIGPFYKKKNIELLKKFCLRKKLKVNYLKFKKDIDQNLINMDIIITSSGLSKYQILRTGYPFIVFCENKFQQRLHQGFEKKKLNLTLKNLNQSKTNILKIQNFLKEIKILKKIQKVNQNILNEKKIFLFTNYLKNEIYH